MIGSTVKSLRKFSAVNSKQIDPGDWAIVAALVDSRIAHTEARIARLQAKLADLEGQSQITDPEVLQRKRAVIEAAVARAKAARESWARS